MVRASGSLPHLHLLYPDSLGLSPATVTAHLTRNFPLFKISLPHLSLSFLLRVYIFAACHPTPLCTPALFVCQNPISPSVPCGCTVPSYIWVCQHRGESVTRVTSSRGTQTPTVSVNRFCRFIWLITKSSAKDRRNESHIRGALKLIGIGVKLISKPN